MKIWQFIKHDLGFYKRVAETEIHFHEGLWKTIRGGNAPIARRPLNQYYGTLRDNRLKIEYRTLTSMSVLLAMLTAYLLWSENWMGFAVWLMFFALVVRSVVIIKILQKKRHQ